MALAAQDANDRAQQMISLSNRLTGLLLKETKLFLARTPQEAASFAEEKSQLARIYRTETSRISRDPALLASATAALKSDLRATTIKFNAALESNHRATNAIRTITQGMVRSVATEVAKARAAKTGYGANGTNNNTNRAMSAITLDQKV
ncbi:MAG: flagellar basal body protein [Robiginitomaculum sp.]|nr:MAG: flagellar basal body protein [Robiginitomaculum sp.]